MAEEGEVKLRKWLWFKVAEFIIWILIWVPVVTSELWSEERPAQLVLVVTLSVILWMATL